MAISIHADAERRIFVATATGDVTFAQLRDFIQSVRTGERRSWPLIFELTDATSSITAEQVQSLAVNVGSALRNEGPRGAVAIVADADLLFGLMRMYQTLCEQQGVDTIQVFRSRQEADAWLRI